MKKKILIISVSAGSGHVQAGKALLEQVQEHFSGIAEAKHIDLLDYTSKPVRYMVKDFYESVVKYVPGVWGIMYDFADNSAVSSTVSILNKVTAPFQWRDFYGVVEQYQPDVIICTHSFVAKVLEHRRATGGLHIPVVAVITDYGLHAFQLMSEIQMLCVATEEMYEEANKKVGAECQVKLTGIPVSVEYTKEKNNHDLRKKLGIDAQKKVILLLSGGMGLVRSDEVLEAMLKKIDVSTYVVICIAGNNLQLEKRLSDIASEQLGHRSEQVVRVLGWVDGMDEYLRVADVVVTKPGGLTTTECLVLKKPVIVFDPIPGQEEDNADFLVRSGFGHVVEDPEQVLQQIEELIQRTNSGYTVSSKQYCERLKKSAFEIISNAVGLTT